MTLMSFRTTPSGTLPARVPTTPTPAPMEPARLGFLAQPRPKAEGRIIRTARSTLCINRTPTLPFSGPGLYSVRVHGGYHATAYVADLPPGHRLSGLAVQIHYSCSTFPNVDQADALVAKARLGQLLVMKVSSQGGACSRCACGREDRL